MVVTPFILCIEEAMENTLSLCCPINCHIYCQIGIGLHVWYMNAEHWHQTLLEIWYMNNKH